MLRSNGPADEVYADLPALLVDDYTEVTEERLCATLAEYRTRSFNWAKLSWPQADGRLEMHAHGIQFDQNGSGPVADWAADHAPALGRAATLVLPPMSLAWVGLALPPHRTMEATGSRGVAHWSLLLNHGGSHLQPTADSDDLAIAPAQDYWVAARAAVGIEEAAFHATMKGSK